MIGTLLLPFHVIIIPQYIMFKKLGLVDTYWPLILPKFLATEAFFVFLIVQFIRNIPRDMDEAARIDGAGHLRIFFSIILPLIKPALITSAIFTFIWTWNDFLGPLLYLNSPEKYPLPIALRLYNDATSHLRLRRDGRGLLPGPGADPDLLHRLPALPRRRRRHAGTQGLGLRMSRATDRAARRAALSGSGPTHDDSATTARFPGAKSAFGLLGEVLLVGILMAIVSLPVITIPAALAAGVRHLRRYLKAEDSGLAWFWRDVRASLLGGVGIGAASVVLAAVLALDIDLAGSGVLPGGPIVGVVGWVGLAALVLALFTRGRPLVAEGGLAGRAQGRAPQRSARIRPARRTSSPRACSPPSSRGSSCRS